MRTPNILLTTLLALFIVPAQGAIILGGTSLQNDLDGSTSGTLNFSQTASSGATYLFALYGRNLAVSPTVTYDVGGVGTVVNPSAFVNFDVTPGGSGTEDVFAAIFRLDVGTVSAGSVTIGWNSGSTNTSMDIFQLSGATGASVLTNTATAIGTTTANSAVLNFDLGAVPATDSFALLVGVNNNNAIQGGGFTLTGGSAPTKSDFDPGAYTTSTVYDLGSVTQTYSLGMRSNAAGAILALSVVPEPTSLTFLALGLGCGILLHSRRR